MNTKHTRLFVSLLSIFIITLSMSMALPARWTSPVKGSVDPSNGATRAWLFSRIDTLNAPVVQGNFLISNAKPGNYMLMLEGRPPYHDSFKQDVLVVDGQPTDVGVIAMHQ
jgi:hypothetical protein